jgi:hypothetical protein
VSGERTVWRLVRVPGWPSGLNVTVTVDTTARAVLAAVERAAEAHGIVLVRVVEPE